MNKPMQKDKSVKKRIRKEIILSLDSKNYMIIGGGLVAILLGYIALSMEPWNGFMALTVAPILLVLGYCVLIPLGIIYKKSSPASDTAPSAE